jgi:hypothetical protein
MKMRQSGNAKIWVLVGALVIAAGAIMFLGDSYLPSGKDAAGTIVPAERYRAGQIESDDVVLGDDTLARFMQTEEFEMLVTN